MTLKVHAPQNVARLFRNTPEKVRKAIIALHDSRPPFSYEPLYEDVWRSLRLKESFDQLICIFNGWQPSVRRDSYLRAIEPTQKFFENFDRNYEADVVARPYSIGRGLQAPFAPRMIFGTEKGPVVPWLLFWKDNPLTEEQTALFHSIALDAFREDPDLDRAKLALIDTSKRALDKDGNPRVAIGAEIPLVSFEKMRSMLAIFAEGYFLAKREIDGRVRPQRTEKRQGDAARQTTRDQPGLF